MTGWAGLLKVNFAALSAALLTCAMAGALIFLPFASAAESGDKIVVAAASDLNFVLKELAAGFEKETGTKVVISFGSTGMLSQQIESGAPFDLFFAADRRYVDELAGRGLISQGSIVSYAQGRLALVVNRSSGVRAGGLKDIAQGKIKRIAIANPEHAPYGKAAVEALKSAGVYEAVKERLVFGENIRQALQFVQAGDAQVGIVANSIADVPEVSAFPIDPSLHKPLTQGVGVLGSSKNTLKADAFIKYAIGRHGRAVFERFGFLVPERK